MHLQRENLDIIFRKTNPETILADRYVCNLKNTSETLQPTVGNYDMRSYQHFATQNFPEYSNDELFMRQQLLGARIEEESGIFSLLYKYADKVLVLHNREPFCKAGQMLNWNSITKRLGQDIFVTAWLAWKEVEEPDIFGRRMQFLWPAILKTDDNRLDEIFQKGLAENHCHLNGSTQSFSISWVCLMNYPKAIHSFLKNKKMSEDNLDARLYKSAQDAPMGWKERIRCAVLIRARLFQKCMGCGPGKDAKKRMAFYNIYGDIPSEEINGELEALRLCYGEKFAQSNGSKKCLDYAISSHWYYVDEKHHNRLLAGERCFMYHCFRNIFSGKFLEDEKDLFYAYLLIKNQFRGEMIQVNKKFGFSNFAQYQDRKNVFFGGFSAYWEESYRLSICAGIRDNQITSMESRFGPESNAVKMKKNVSEIDRMAQFAFGKEKKNYFYVTHFGKRQIFYDKLIKSQLYLCPRNYKVRAVSKKQAIALVRYFQEREQENPRIAGIDAAAHEIGCRPETFATEFRYIRSYGKIRGKNPVMGEEIRHRDVGVTYHAGEDFLDIIDGIRAIDEAVQFLHMGSGDRIGHALALGIAPCPYYDLKRFEICMMKQDCLDNLLWLLNRSIEWGIDIEAGKRLKMQHEAERLYYELYVQDRASEEIIHSGSTDILQEYYYAYLLRGDHPELYRSGKYKGVKCRLESRFYETCMKDPVKELELYRRDPVVNDILYLYHYDMKVRKKGLETKIYWVESWYVKLAEEMQNVLRARLSKKNISIECNPTSNVLIGTFRRYDQHPVTTFNDYPLNVHSTNERLQVSINTDDLGVFDTSLQQEYALLFEAIQRKRHLEGEYNDEAIYEYLEHLRESGFRVSFKSDIADTIAEEENQEEKVPWYREKAYEAIKT